MLSPDDKTLLLHRDGSTGIELWEVETGQPRLRIEPPSFCDATSFSPGGAMLVAGCSDGVFRFWDAHTGRLVLEQGGHRGPVTAVAFAPDGRRLATGGWDTTVLVWNLADLGLAGRPRLIQLQPAELPALWGDLAGSDASKAYRAIGKLIAAPDQALPLLRGRLRPAAAADPERLPRLLAGLDDRRFAARERATAELQKLTELAEPALRKALAGQPSAEARRRIEQLLDKLERAVPSADRLRRLRAVEVLEQIGSRESRQVLQALAKGAAQSRLTQEAKASLGRLAKGAVAGR
ncbi:MAG TPA: hypothetical protein VG013_43445 [Gemmataceae bacterium]|nr:hypothetical protein [Gemmataceae bacterium]